MDGGIALLVAVVAVALFFDFTNGFHDTANAVATSVSTRALSPAVAVSLAAVLNFAGAFFNLKVAGTVAKDVIDPLIVTQQVVLAGLIGAIAWNLFTWRLGLPSSSSHALIGGVAGAAIARVGFGDAMKWDGLVHKVAIPAGIAPVAGVVGALVLTTLIYWLFRRASPSFVNRWFRHGQILSASALAFSHGTNDAQKTMGIITLALIAHGTVSADNFAVPTWVVITAASAIALGTYVGGWRIMRTMGQRVIKMDPAQGFAAQTAGSAVILTATHFGFPLSTTHTISGAVIGSGMPKRVSAVRWGVAGNIFVAWLLTLPAAALVGAGIYGVTSIF